MPIFFVTPTDIEGNLVRVSEPLRTHLAKSLRVRVGETIVFGGNKRKRFRAKITKITPHHVEAEIFHQEVGPTPKGTKLSIAQAVLKSERMNWVVQKATELGVSTIIPLLSSRVIIRPALSKLSDYQERWQRIAHEAAQQSEQWEITQVARPSLVSEFLNQAQSSTLNIILSERVGGERLSVLPLPQDPIDHVVLTVGPEGGWSEEEMERAARNGFVSVTLGEQILRGETAAIASISILQSRLGNL